MDDELRTKILSYVKEHKDASDYDVAKVFKISRSSVYRLKKGMRLRFIDTLTDDEAEEYREYLGLKGKKNNGEEGEDSTKKKWFPNILRPLLRTRQDILNGVFSNEDYEDPMVPSLEQHTSFMANYIPKFEIQGYEGAVNKQGFYEITGPFMGKISSATKVLFPKFFLNPLNALDLIVLQDIYMNTICGTIIDVLVAFTMGRGVRPVLKLNNEEDIELEEQTLENQPDAEKLTSIGLPAPPPEKPKMETKEMARMRILDENKKLLDPLIAIDKSFGDPEIKDPFLDETWDDKVEALIRNHWVYGRAMLTYEYFPEYTFTWKDKKFPDIPNIVKPIHPRDMNYVHINQPTQKLVSVSLMFSSQGILANDMLYMEHRTNSPIYNGKFFGYSLMMRMIDDGRNLRKIKSVDLPNIATVGYTGTPLFIFKKDSKGTAAESAQNTRLVNNLGIGMPNAMTTKDPKEDVMVFDINPDPKISEMIELCHYHAEAAAKSAEVPTTLVSKEKDPNRDTLLGILRLFVENVIKRKRVTIGKVLDAQWYMKNFRIIYKEQPEILEKFHIECEFDDFKLESWADLVSSVVELNKLHKLKAEANGELLGITNFENKIDPDAAALEDGISFEDRNGDKFNMSKEKGKPGQQQQQKQQEQPKSEERTPTRK